MFRNRKALVVVLGLALVAAVLVGCAAGEEKATPTVGGQTAVSGTATTAAAAEPKRGGTLNLYHGDPSVIDPQRAVGSNTQWTTVGSTLVRFPTGPEYDYTDLASIPELAESWEISADGRTYTFHLRQGVKWQNKPPVNGREFVAADVKFTFDRLYRVSRYLYGYQLGDVKSVEAPDKYTVKFTLGDVYPPFLTHIASYWAVILPPECEEKIEGGFDKTEATIGTGPFILESYQPNVKAVFKRNADYFRSPLPYLDGVTAYVIADTAARQAALRAGNLDILTVDYTSLEQLKKTNPELVVSTQVTLGGWAIALGSDKPPFDDVRVRQAVALGINRQEWVDTIYGGAGVVDNGPLPAGMKAWKVPTDQLGEGAKYFTYNTQEARRLLAEAGYPNGFETEFTISLGVGRETSDSYDLIVDYLSKVGIRATIRPLESGAWLATVASGAKYEGMAYSGQWTVLDPDLTLWGFYYPGQLTNISRTNDPKLNAMLEEQRRVMDAKERKKVIDEIQRYLAVQNYRVSAPYPHVNYVSQPWVRNYMPKVYYDYGRIYELIWLGEK